MLKNIALAALVYLLPFGFVNGASVVVDPAASEFRVDVKATAHSFEVMLDSYLAKLEVGADGALEKADFSFACEALDSDNKKRDKKMRVWLESETLPEIRFHLNSVKSQGDSLVGLGNLTLHGVTRPVSVPFTMETVGGKVTLTGRASIDHREYGLDIITMLFFKVDPELEVSFKLVGEIEK